MIPGSCSSLRIRQEIPRVLEGAGTPLVRSVGGSKPKQKRLGGHVSWILEENLGISSSL